MDVDLRVAYSQRIIRGASLKNYKVVLAEYKQSTKEVAGDKWYLGALKGLSMENLWDWAKKYGIGYDRDAYLGLDKCVDFEKELWFELGKFMWRKHRSIYQYHMKYVCNDILKPFRVSILHNTEHVREMHDLSKYLPTPPMKGESYEEANWKFLGQYFTVSEIRVATKQRLPSSIQDELDDHQEDYRSLSHEY